MLWGLRVPIWKMNLCFRFLRLSVIPWCRERPQIEMCSLEWLGRLKCRATGFDASLSSFSASRRCSRNRSPRRLPVSPMYSFLHNVQLIINNPVKALIIKNFKILQKDPETGAIFSQPPLISFKRDKNVGNFLVKSTFRTTEKPGTFKCARSRCKSCPFVQNADNISGSKRSVKITDRFTCTSANLIYCISCTLCKKIQLAKQEDD